MHIALSLFKPGLFGYSMNDLIRYTETSGSVYLLSVDFQGGYGSDFIFMHKSKLLHRFGGVETSGSVIGAAHQVVKVVRSLHSLREDLIESSDGEIEYEIKITSYCDRLMEHAYHFLRIETGYDENFEMRFLEKIRAVKILVEEIRRAEIIDRENVDSYIEELLSFIPS